MRPILAELRSKAYSGTLLIAEFRKRMIIVKCAGTFETRKEIRSAEPQYSREGARFIDDRGRSPHAVPDDAEQAHRSFFAGAADIQKSHLPPFSATRDVVHADLRAGNSGNIHDAGLHSGRGSGNAKNAYLNRRSPRDAEHSYLNGRHPGEVSDTDLHCAHGRRCVRNAHLSAREGIRTDIQNAYLPADGRINDDIRHADLRPVHFLSDIQSRRNLRAFDVSRIIQRNGSLNASGTFLSDVCKQTQLQAQKRTVRLGHKQSEHHALARFSFDVEQINTPARFSILLQGIKSIVSVSARCRALHGDFRKSVRSERRAPVLRERHIRGRCLGRAFHLHAVNAPSKPELKLAATHLAEFRDKRPGCIADEHASFDVRAEHEPGGSSTDIRHHHVTRAREVHIPARMLHAAESRLRILKRFVERELLRLRTRHLAVSGNIARAAEPAHQGLRKERAAQPIALLAGFILRARSDERIALHTARSVRHASPDRATALHPRARCNRRVFPCAPRFAARAFYQVHRIHSLSPARKDRAEALCSNPGRRPFPQAPWRKPKRRSAHSGARGGRFRRCSRPRRKDSVRREPKQRRSRRRKRRISRIVCRAYQFSPLSEALRSVRDSTRTALFLSNESMSPFSTLKAEAEMTKKNFSK